MSAPPYPADVVVYPEPPPSYDEAMGLLPAGGQPVTAESRSRQGSMHDIIARSQTNSRQSSRQPSPTRQVNCPYPLTAEIVPRDGSPHIIRPFLGGSTGSITVLEQPTLEGYGVSWVAKPPEEPTCPTGLEYLLDREYVQVKRERRNFLGKRRTFSVRNNQDKMIYLVIESGKVRCAAVDHHERPVFTYVEEWGMWRSDWLELPEGDKAAYFEENSGCCANTQKIKDENKCPIIYLETSCCGDDNDVFTVYSRSHATIGSLEKSSGTYKIKFPLDLDVRMKAALISMAMRLEIAEEKRRGEYL